MRLRRHPRFERISRYADGEVAKAEGGRIADHLGRCRRCRAELAFVRRLASVARGLRPAGPGAKGLQDVLRRRAGGERVILPLSPTGGNPGPHRRWP